MDEPKILKPAIEEMVLGKTVVEIERNESWMRLRLHDGTDMIVKAAQHEFLDVHVEISESAAEEACLQASESTWVSVEDRLPSLKEPVLIFHVYRAVGWLADIRREPRWVEQRQPGGFFGIKPKAKVTHWAPLPPRLELKGKCKTGHWIKPSCAGCKNFEPIDI